MKKIGFETFVDYKFVSNPRISPNGEMTAFVVQTTNLETNGYDGDIYILCNKTGTSRRLTALGDGKGFAWTAQNKLIFSADRVGKAKKARENGKLLTVYYEIDPMGGEAVEIFSISGATGGLTELSKDLYMTVEHVDLNAPDFAAMEEKERAEAVKEYLNPRYQVFDEVPFWGNNIGYTSLRRDTLCIFDAKSGELKRITPKLFHLDGASFGFGKIAFTGSEFEGIPPIFDEKFYVYDIKSGKTTTISAPGFSIGSVTMFSEDCIAVQMGEAAFGSFATGDLYFFDMKGKMQKVCDIDAFIGSNSVGSDARLGGGQGVKAQGGKLWFVETMINDSHLRCMDADGKLSAPMTQPGSTDSFDVLGERIVICAMRGNKLAELYAVENGKERQLTDFNGFVEREYSVVEPQPFSYTGSDKVEIFGWVMPPVGYKKGKKCPSILHIHGGPRTVFGSVFHNEMQMWANAGYFVLFCNPRGGDGRGRDFANLYGKYGSVDYVNLMEFADQCIERYPDIDPERMGVTGGSYGGFMTNWIVGHTDRFKAAATQRCISNWISFEGTTDIGYFFNLSQHGTNVAQNPQKLWDLSPLKYAKNVKTPLLFIHSDQDYRCWMAEALEMFTAIKMNGVPSRVALFHGDNHELSRSGHPRNRVKRMEEIEGWMGKYLK